MDELPLTLMGVRVLIDDGKYVRRSWKQRLFSWPWRPWRAEQWIDPYIKPDQVIVMAGPPKTFVMSTATYNRAKAAE